LALAGDPDQIEGVSLLSYWHHLLLLWTEFEYFRINQSMEYIVEDVATFGGVP